MDANCCSSRWCRIRRDEYFEHHDDDDGSLLKFFIDNAKMMETI